MFPWVCLATMPLFYPFDWPKVLLSKFELYYVRIKNNICTPINGVFADKGCNCNLTAEEKDDTDCVNHVKSVDKVIKSSGTKKLVSNEPEGIKKTEQTEDNIEEDDVFKDDLIFETVRNIDENNAEAENDTHANGHHNNRKRLTLYLIIFHVVTQAFLPYSHFITKVSRQSRL